MTTGKGVNQGKTKFVKEYLAEHGDVKRAAINEAWQAAGHEDEISESLVYKMRSQYGLTARQGDAEDDAQEVASPADEGKKSTSKNRVESVTVEEQPTASAEAAKTTAFRPHDEDDEVLDEIEDQIDLLIQRVRDLGNRADVVKALRRARRILFSPPGN